MKASAWLSHCSSCASSVTERVRSPRWASDEARDAAGGDLVERVGEPGPVGDASAGRLDVVHELRQLPAAALAPGPDDLRAGVELAVAILAARDRDVADDVDGRVRPRAA